MTHSAPGPSRPTAADWLFGGDEPEPSEVQDLEAGPTTPDGGLVPLVELPLIEPVVVVEAPRLAFHAVTWPGQVPTVEQLGRWIGGAVQVPPDACAQFDAAVASLAAFERELPLHDPRDPLARAVCLRLRLRWALATRPSPDAPVDEAGLVALALEADPALSALKAPDVVARYGTWVDQVRNALVAVGFDMGEVKVVITSDLAESRRTQREAARAATRDLVAQQAVVAPAPSETVSTATRQRRREGVLAVTTVITMFAVGAYHAAMNPRVVASALAGLPTGTIGVQNPTNGSIILRPADSSPEARIATARHAAGLAEHQGRPLLETPGGFVVLPAGQTAPPGRIPPGVLDAVRKQPRSKGGR